MTKVYRITPLEKKNAEIIYDVFEDKEGQLRNFHIEELYRWGLGFREETDPVTEYEYSTKAIACPTDVGYGQELDDLINVSFDFDESFSEEEKDEIKELWYEGGASWLYDGEHNWEVDHSSITIYGPVQIDLIDDMTGEVFEENIVPEIESSPMEWKTISDEAASAWPFPVQKNFGETDKSS